MVFRNGWIFDDHSMVEFDGPLVGGFGIARPSVQAVYRGQIMDGPGQVAAIVWHRGCLINQSLVDLAGGSKGLLGIGNFAGRAQGGA